jgi:hypothetical protein
MRALNFRKCEGSRLKNAGSDAACVEYSSNSVDIGWSLRETVMPG